MTAKNKAALQSRLAAIRFHSPGRKSKPLPLPRRPETATFTSANQSIGRAMDRLRYEPFGERLAPEGDVGSRSRASRYLLWAGTGLFWSLVVGIVTARAVFFEPGVFDEFTRVAALVKAAIF
jgi:hypothetical protein